MKSYNFLRASNAADRFVDKFFDEPFSQCIDYWILPQITGSDLPLREEIMVNCRIVRALQKRCLQKTYPG